MGEADFWGRDQQEISSLNQQRATLREKIDQWRKYDRETEDAKILAEMACEENDQPALEEVGKEGPDKAYRGEAPPCPQIRQNHTGLGPGQGDGQKDQGGQGESESREGCWWHVFQSHPQPDEGSPPRCDGHNRRPALQ